MTRTRQLLVFGGLTLMTSTYLWVNLTGAGPGDRTVFLPGTTTAGHHQIEEKCETCHTPFGGVTNEACLTCHGDELARADDSHPLSKFTDPRNAELITRLDASQCITCHREHAPGMVRPMGVTRPDDYCVTCHADVGTERSSHEGMAFTTCATAGCHNYHDNTALYEDFLAAHAGEPPLQAHPRVATRDLRLAIAVQEGAPVPQVPRLASDGPRDAADPRHVASWEAAVHARAGVNCSGCHTGGGASGTAAWVTRPDEQVCASCHRSEVDGFGSGRHGMRVANGLPRLTVAMARVPMKQPPAVHELRCSSCHPAHSYDTQPAAVDACLGCHDDRHSRAYLRSPHYALLLQERAGEAAAGTGVSCATCHLPRMRRQVEGRTIVTVQHNQNDNLRPNEKMVRSVCLDCHGLGFAIDALADPRLITSNFTGTAVRSVAGIDMATTRLMSKPN